MSRHVDVLAVGAHVGDCEIACGMALAAHVRQGMRVGMLHLTLGEKGHPTMPPQEYAEQRKAEAAASAEVFGAELYLFEYGDGELQPDDAVKHRIAQVIRECTPAVVLTHWHGSMHRDHTAAALCMPDALFYAALPAFAQEAAAHRVRALYYAENWEDQSGFVPEVFLEINEADLALWEEAARKHALFRGEVSRFPYLDYYRSLARLRGCEIGCQYAVALAVPPWAHRRRVTSLVG